MSFNPVSYKKQKKESPAREKEMLESLTATTIGKLTKTFLLSMARLSNCAAACLTGSHWASIIRWL